MTMLFRRPSSSARPNASSPSPARGSHPNPSSLLPARPLCIDKVQPPLTWEDLLGRR